MSVPATRVRITVCATRTSAASPAPVQQASAETSARLVSMRDTCAALILCPYNTENCLILQKSSSAKSSSDS